MIFGLMNVSYGEEIARLVFILEMGGLQHLIEPKDLLQ
jgi:hypothetical protein